MPKGLKIISKTNYIFRTVLGIAGVDNEEDKFNVEEEDNDRDE